MRLLDPTLRQVTEKNVPFLKPSLIGAIDVTVVFGMTVLVIDAAPRFHGESRSQILGMVNAY